jgi:hypothetical protein
VGKFDVASDSIPNPKFSNVLSNLVLYSYWLLKAFACVLKTQIVFSNL